MMKKEMNFKTRLTREEIALLPRKKFCGEIYYVNSGSDLHKVIPILKKEGVFGFDTESFPQGGIVHWLPV